MYRIFLKRSVLSCKLLSDTFHKSCSSYIMDTQVDDVVGVYRDFARFPSVSLAKVFNADTPGHVRIYSEWKQRDLERSENIKFARNHVVHLDSIFSTSPTDLGTQLLTAESPTGKYRAVLRKVKTKKGEDKQYIEVWSDTCKVHNIDVDGLEQHGDVYEDGTFGCWAWSHSETHLLYVAEKKRPKAKSFFDKKAAEEEKKDEAFLPENSKRGLEHVFYDDWGETMTGKCKSVLCVLDVEDGAVSTLDNLPDDVAAGQAIWCANDSGVVCVGWFTEPYHLGIYACPIRRSALFHVDLKTSSCSVIGSSDCAVRSPRFNQDHSKLIYLENKASGAHMQCSQLVLCDWSTKGIVPVVDIVQKHSAADKDEFPGIYLDQMSKRCWAEDKKRIVITTHWRSRKELVVVNVETGKVTKITNDESVGCWHVLDVNRDLVVAVCASPNKPQYLVFGLLPSEGKEDSIKWTVLDSETAHFDDITWSVHPMTVPEDKRHPQYPDLDYECYLMEPTTSLDSAVQPPLIAFLHGGPHSVCPLDFSVYLAGLVRCGYAILAVNYRGSYGFGEDNIDSLHGRIGSQDVEDCQRAVEEFVKLKKYSQVVVIGGSHGGFLTAHLIGQYPDFYKAAVSRNPVINLVSMLGTTDIPDWCLVEAGLEFDFKHSGSSDVYNEMWTKSPLSHVDQIKTPVMLMIGSDDRRVPPKQGHELRKALQARGVPVKVLEYAGNTHSLNKVDAEADAFVQIVLWFNQHCQ